MRPADLPVAEGILFTDQYQLILAQRYYRMGLHDRHVQFDHFVRHYPDDGAYKAGYCINAGPEWLLDCMRRARVRDDDLDHLRSQTGRSGGHVFHDDSLAWLWAHGSFDGLTRRAIPIH